MSLHELLAVSSDYVSFANQIFVVLRQVTKSSAKAPIPDVNNIVEIIGIARNKDLSGYSLSRLDISRHMTMSFAQFFFVSSRIIEAQNLGQKALVTFVPSTTNFYSSRDKRTIVINSVLHETDHDLISVRDQFVDAINHGLFGCLRCNEGYRSGRAKKSPVLHTGYTMSNCGEYKNNRQNQMGGTNPSLITSYMDNASIACKQSYGKGIAMLNCLFQQSPDAFGVGNPRVDEQGLIEDMLKKYKEFFAIDKLEHNSSEFSAYIRNSASTALFNTHIDDHLDTLNDPNDGNCAVVAISISLDRKKYDHLIPSKVCEWLDLTGCTDRIPFCHLNYSRKVCANASTRLSREEVLFRNASDKSNVLKRAIFDAVSDVSSITDYQNTLDKMAGIGYDEVRKAIAHFNTTQRHVHTRLGQGRYRHVYKDCLDTVGGYVVSNIDDVIFQMQQNSNRTDYNWTNDCLKQGTTNTIPLCMDPQNTYQGPKISLTASYDVNRYQSTNVDAFIDISNHLGKMSPTNTLAFAAFATIQSNSTLPVAEILRLFAQNDWSIKNDFLGARYNGCLWRTMIDVAERTKFKKIGSSRESRFQINTMGKVFEFAKYDSLILNRFSRFSDKDSDEMLYAQFEETLQFLKVKVKHVGHVTGLKFIQLSSILGLLPLKIATFANVESGGPGKLLRLFDPDPNDMFQRIHSEFASIWGGNFTFAFLENVLCELLRELQATLGKSKDIHADELSCLHKSGGKFHKLSSHKKDHIVLYSHRGFKNSMQTLFRIKVIPNGKAVLEVRKFEVDYHNSCISCCKKIVVDNIFDIRVTSMYNYQ